MRAEVNGVEIHYEIDGVGPPCFVIHGGLGLDHTAYRKTLQPLANRLQLIFMDVRGNGRSGRPPVYDLTMESMADDVAALADILGLDRFALFGHSYGGFITQEILLRHPSRANLAILVGTGPSKTNRNGTAEDHALPPRPAGLVQLPPPHDDESAGLYWKAALPYFTNEASVSELQSAMTETIFANDALWRSDEIYETWSTIDRLDSIEVPVLVLVGEHDLIWSPTASAQITARLSRGSLVELKGSNHFPWIETPEPFFRTVDEWLDQQL